MSGRKSFCLVFLFLLAVAVTAIFTSVCLGESETDAKQKAVEFRASAYEFQQNGKLDEAMLYYQKASWSDPTNPEYYNDIGVLYEMRGLPGKAEEAYMTALKQDQSFLKAHTNLALLYEKQGKTDLAIKHLKVRVAKGNPDDQWTKDCSAMLERLTGEKAALEKNKTEKYDAQWHKEMVDKREFNMTNNKGYIYISKSASSKKSTKNPIPREEMFYAKKNVKDGFNNLCNQKSADVVESKKECKKPSQAIEKSIAKEPAKCESAKKTAVDQTKQAVSSSKKPVLVDKKSDSKDANKGYVYINTDSQDNIK